jgi:hypothetical protein
LIFGGLCLTHQCFDNRKDSAAQIVVADFSKFEDHLHCHCIGKQFEWRRFAGRWLFRFAPEERFDRHSENFRNLVESTATDPVSALFVFLHLLKGDAELSAKLFLCETAG